MSKNRSWGIILQYLQMAAYVVINLVYTPVMLRILGQNEYGIYSLASSVIAYLNLISLGFGACYIRFYSIFKAEDDQKSVNSLNGLYLIVFSAMGLLACILGFVLSSNVRVFFNDTYSTHDLYIAKVLMIFLTINLSISFPMSVFTAYVTSQEKFIFQKLLNLAKTIISPCVNIVLLYIGYGSIGMVIGTTLISFFADLINVRFCLKKLNMKFDFKNPKLFMLKDIFAFSFFIAFLSPFI